MQNCEAFNCAHSLWNSIKYPLWTCLLSRCCNSSSQTRQCCFCSEEKLPCHFFGCFCCFLWFQVLWLNQHNQQQETSNTYIVFFFVVLFLGWVHGADSCSVTLFFLHTLFTKAALLTERTLQKVSRDGCSKHELLFPTVDYNLRASQ